MANRPRKAGVGPVGRRATILSLVVFPLLIGAAVSMAGASPPIDLGVADPFAVLAGTTITNAGTTTINGDVGLHPGPAISDLGTMTVNGATHVANAEALAAKNALTAAYLDAAGRGPATSVATELGGQTLAGGVYDSQSGTFQITGTLTLDGAGNPDSVWVIQAATTLLATPGSTVSLINEADPCNVFWQVGSSATLQTTATFVGTIMALTDVHLLSGATVQGRALARNGEVTLISNTITVPVCAEDDGGTTTTTEAGGGTTTTTLPSGGPGTGGGSTAGFENLWLLLLGGVLLAGAFGVIAVRRQVALKDEPLDR